MYDGPRLIRVPVGPFIRDRFYSGKSLSECFEDFEREYGRYGFRKGEPFDPLRAAVEIRGEWFRLKKVFHLPPDGEAITLESLLDHPPGRPRACPREDPRREKRAIYA
jgi:hypothetical protein